MLTPAISGGGSRGAAAMTDKEAGQIAHGLIQGYMAPTIGPWIMSSFYRALVQAL